MFTLAGLRIICVGDLLFDQRSIANMPAYERVSLGLVLVPDVGACFPL